MLHFLGTAVLKCHNIWKLLSDDSGKKEYVCVCVCVYRQWKGEDKKTDKTNGVDIYNK